MKRGLKVYNNWQFDNIQMCTFLKIGYSTFNKEHNKWKAYWQIVNAFQIA